MDRHIGSLACKAFYGACKSASAAKRARSAQNEMAAAVRTVVSPSVTSANVALASATPCEWFSSKPDAHSLPLSSATPRRVW
eukprot:scaffold239817_cov35-Tisochrysis_lutea.AAC.1